MKKSKEIIVPKYAFSWKSGRNTLVFILEKWKCFVVFYPPTLYIIQKKLLSLPMSR